MDGVANGYTRAGCIRWFCEACKKLARTLFTYLQGLINKLSLSLLRKEFVLKCKS